MFAAYNDISYQDKVCVDRQTSKQYYKMAKSGGCGGNEMMQCKQCLCFTHLWGHLYHLPQNPASKEHATPVTVKSEAGRALDIFYLN